MSDGKNCRIIKKGVCLSGIVQYSMSHVHLCFINVCVQMIDL